ncbi:hypothetical protein TNCV_5062951 [Trichonephila clavipes]|nr:hypothetical protein TNCV_5062951 [Trichonephila clavipes]
MQLDVSSFSMTRNNDSMGGHYTAAQGLWVTDLVVLRNTPELTTLSPNFHITPTEGYLRLDIFNVHWPLLHGGS